ncbi:MAG: site-2 protease family protein [Chitinophagaceae bacterium]|nr:site-2 protease family protein [Anaerolineae bacterium]
MLLYGSSLTPTLALGILLGVLIGMTVHEFAHNYVAHLMGDPVPAREGRLTLDPTVHIYWPGFLMFVLIGFGILGTAPISANRMRNPRWGYLAAVAAGPFSNLLVAIVFAIPLRLFLTTLPDSISLVLFMIVRFNLLLFLFNLLPFFPIDGWHILLALLPPDLAYTWQRNAQNTQYILLGLILLSFLGPNFNLLGIIINGPLSFFQQILLGF